eukprot:GEMP01004382.1.p1 GENE.GEMP01004382.1~~GEMP01004382.1.p1  ORF type:complete len:908 (+),score=172.24 GEMP01004382.1:56-2779(+)
MRERGLLRKWHRLLRFGGYFARPAHHRRSSQRTKNGEKDRRRPLYGTERLKKKKTGFIPVPVDVTDEIKELEKQANVLYLNGKYEATCEVLEKIITECPKYAVPYHMMSSIHADLGNKDKSLAFGMVAASLCPNDADTWLRIGKAYIDGDPKLALACIKRSVRLNETTDAFVHLALAYEECGNTFLALKQGWEKAWELRKKGSHPGRLDLIAQPLAKAYYRREKWHKSREVLEACLAQPPPLTPQDKEIHTKTIFFLSDVLLGPLRMFRACADMILKHLGLDAEASKLPLPGAALLRRNFKQRCVPEILKNLAVSLILIGRFEEGIDESSEKIFRGTPRAESLICIEAMYAVFEQPYDTCGEMIIELIDAMMQMNHLSEAFRILNRFRQDPSFDEFPGELQLRIGKVAFREQRYHEALIFLGPALDNPELELNKTEDSNLRIMVAEILHKLGNFDECSRVLLPMSFRELSSVKKLPPAMSTQKRKELFFELCKSIRENTITEDFVPQFTHLVHDCELDILRVTQLRINERPDRERPAEEGDDEGPVKAPKGFLADTTARRKIGLESIENMYGTEVWFEFVRRGALVLGRVGRLQTAVEMIEAVISGRKEYRRMNSQRYLPRLQNTSMVLALESGNTKVAFKYIRQHIMKRESNAVDERLVALFSRLLVASRMAYDPSQWRIYSNSSLTTAHKATASAAFSDYSKWAVRLLLAHPKCLSLILLTGHLCIISGQYRTSAEEYERAYRLVPTHPMPPLCAAAAHVSLSMSRAITNRHAWVAKAIVYLRLYASLRQGEYLQAEVAYNEGRLFHQIGILQTAATRYRAALKLLDTYPDRCDINALRRSVIFNLAHIYRSSGNIRMARKLICRIRGRLACACVCVCAFGTCYGLLHEEGACCVVVCSIKYMPR